MTIFGETKVWHNFQKLTNSSSIAFKIKDMHCSWQVPRDYQCPVSLGRKKTHSTILFWLIRGCWCINSYLVFVYESYINGWDGHYFHTCLLSPTSTRKIIMQLNPLSFETQFLWPFQQSKFFFLFSYHFLLLVIFTFFVFCVCLPLSFCPITSSPESC